MFSLGSRVAPSNGLNSFNKVPLNGYLNGGDILMSEKLKANGIK
jgi:hypothetical protein